MDRRAPKTTNEVEQQRSQGLAVEGPPRKSLFKVAKDVLVYSSLANSCGGEG